MPRDNLEALRIDKTKVEVARLGDNLDDRAYWHSRTPQERLEMTEALRQLNYGYDPATARLERVLEVVART
jgi:hypothetical protein